jgi:3-oxoacyl-[acyl-carrier protein] reductase
VVEFGIKLYGPQEVGQPLAAVLEEHLAALRIGEGVLSSAWVSDLFGTADEHFGQVDIAVLCAGILRFNLVGDVTDDEWNAVIDTHLKGMFLCAQAAQKVMVPRKYGKMVLLSSGAARGYRARIHYSAAKAGIEAMTRVLAIELGPSNINVNGVAPGFVETRMPQQHAEWLGEDYETFKASAVAQTPLRRAGTPEEQAAVKTPASDGRP